MFPMFSEHSRRIFIFLWALLPLCRTVLSLHCPVIDAEIGFRGNMPSHRLGTLSAKLKSHIFDNSQFKSVVVNDGDYQSLRLRGGSEAAFATASMMGANPEMAKQFFGSNLISQSRKIGPTSTS